MKDERENEMDIYTGFAEVYDTFMDNVPYSEWADCLEGILKEHGVCGGLVLDLGCGTGEVLELLRHNCSEVIGVDGSPRMLELARRRFGEDSAGVSLRIGELDHLPLRDGEADFACINLVLHHLSRPQDALREIARVVRPDGLLLVSDFDRHQQENMRAVYGDRWLGFTREDMDAMLRGAGFETVEYRREEVKLGLALHLVLTRHTS